MSASQVQTHIIISEYYLENMLQWLPVMRKKLTLFCFLLISYTHCVGIFPTGSNQTDFSLFAFLFGLVGGSPTSSQNLTPGA
ncbi:hypothetical protein, partial [Leptospira mtsangambouensis]|uniref:hypothetical protein n=1 Tax=Leptospira mtsangambouensis TaxID=2484912 RepID=UPI001ABF88AC